MIVSPTPRTRMRALLTLTTWTAFLTATLVVLARLPLPPPDGDPVLTAFVIIRMAALAAGAYLALTLVLGVLARLLRLAALVRFLDACTAPTLRRVIAATAGVSLVASAALTWAPAGAVTGGGAPPVMVVIPDTPATPPAPETAPAPTAPAPEPVQQPPPDSVEIHPGDNLWAVAARRLASAWGREPTVAEVVPYWRTVVDRNAGRLVAAGNPDLILPGQVMELPPPPSTPKP